MYDASQRKSPVVYDLGESPFSYCDGRYRFYFSSSKHMEKFADNVGKREQWLTDSISNRFHLSIDCYDLADFQYYMMVEGRGFLVYDNLTGKFIDKPDKVFFSVQVM